MLEYLLACSTVSVGWTRYLVSLLDYLPHHILPAALTSAPFGRDGDRLRRSVRTGAIINVPAMLIVAAAATLCYNGIKQSAIFNTVIVAIKVSIVIAVIIFGAIYINTANWHPFIPPNTGTFGQFGWSGICAASAIIFFAYIGFDGVSTAAQEAKNPHATCRSACSAASSSAPCCTF